MSALFKDQRFSRAWFKNMALVLIGSAIVASGYVFFIVPHKIVPGGLFGISVVLHHLFGVPTGATALLLNVPLLLWGARELGPRFGTKTIVGLALTAAAIDGLSYWWGHQALTDDVLVSAVFGGACIGAGLGLVFKAKATTGGVDIIANILYKRIRLPIGRSLISMDVVIVAGGVLALTTPEAALYAIITIFVSGRVVDAVLEGQHVQKAVFIVSTEHEQIRDTILHALDRGGTVFPAKGLFHGDDRSVILTAVGRRELAVLESEVKRIDPKAFLMVFEAREILGEGFRPLREAGT